MGLYKHKTRNNPVNLGGGPSQTNPDCYEPTAQDLRNNRVYQAPDCTKVSQSFRDNYDAVFGKQDIFKHLAKE
jgi:hypothetical protein